MGLDETVASNIDGVMSTLWTYFFGGDPGLHNGYSITSGKFLGYGGAAVSVFLSISGAYTAGSTVIQVVEESFWSFLEDFQADSKEDYIAILNNPDLSPEFHQFMTYYASNLLILTIVIFWHVLFLIGMGVWSADYLFTKIQNYVTFYNG